MKTITNNELSSIKVPKNLHKILKWMALSKGKFIYQVIAELAYQDMEGNLNGGKNEINL